MTLPPPSSVSPRLDKRRDIPPFPALRAFEAVGRLGGIRQAATALGVDHAAVSRHIKALESWAGVPLLDRRSSPRRLTGKGARYHMRISVALAEIFEASAELAQLEQELRLHLWCVPGFAFQWLMVRLGGFHMQNQDVELNLRPSDRNPDFLAREADGDIRYIRDGTKMPKYVRQLEFARPPVFPVANPELASRLTIRTPEDLLSAPLLHEDSEEEWRLWFRLNGLAVDQRLPGSRLWHAHLTVEAARRGQGVALANTFLVGKELESGILVRLAATERALQSVPLGAYCLLAREDRWSSRALTQFRKWLLETFRAELPPR
ncbi:MAG TPA: LysR substrate-binding domain-containing protein [Allosphingosinicella sp.]